MKISLVDGFGSQENSKTKGKFRGKSNWSTHYKKISYGTRIERIFWS